MTLSSDTDLGKMHGFNKLFIINKCQGRQHSAFLASRDTTFTGEK